MRDDPVSSICIADQITQFKVKQSYRGAWCPACGKRKDHFSFLCERCWETVGDCFRRDVERLASGDGKLADHADTVVIRLFKMAGWTQWWPSPLLGGQSHSWTFKEQKEQKDGT